MAFWKKKTYSRSERLEAAGNLRTKGKKKKAIAEYRLVLKDHPKDFEVHGKMAPLLAETKQYKEAWRSFKFAADGFKQKGFVDKAMSMFNQAARVMPGELQVWEALASLELERGRKVDAIKALYEGHRNFRKALLRPNAIRLLMKLLQIEPGHFDATFNLAGLLKKTGKKQDALKYLNKLVEQNKGKNLRRVRGAIFWTTPGPGPLWHWTRALVLGK